MRRKSLLWGGLMLLLLSGLLCALAGLLWHEPSFYRHKIMPEGKLRSDLSKAFTRQLSTLMGSIIGEQERWQATFTETQVNSWFMEDFVDSGAADKMLPEGISEPRLSVERDVLRLGFRYGQVPWSTVVSIDVRVWMVPKESNTVALELLKLRAGALPISPKILIREVVSLIEKQNAERTSIEVSWYRHNQHPVAVLRFFGSKARPTTQLRQLKIGQGMVTLSGKSVQVPGQVLLTPPPSLAPQVIAKKEPAINPQAN